MTNEIHYVLGFLFSEDFKSVALIKKNKGWQKGCWNGVGGHVEPHERGYDAMIREFQEETGVLVNDWHKFGLMLGLEEPCWDCELYAATSDKIWDVTATTDEAVQTFTVSYVSGSMKDNMIFKTIPNVRWLVPMAVESLTSDKFMSSTAFYR